MAQDTIITPTANQKLLSLMSELNALSDVVQKLQSKALSFFKTVCVKGEKIEMIDEETEKRIGESMKAIERGEYFTLKTEKDIDRFFDQL